MGKELEEFLSNLADGSILLIESEFKGKTSETAGVWFKNWQYGGEISLRQVPLDGPSGKIWSAYTMVDFSRVRKIYRLNKEEIYST